jgi:transposase-like protein
MDKSQFLIEIHLRTGKAIKELARTHDVSPSWLFKLLRRYRLEGPQGLEPKSRRPKSSPSRIADLYEDEIVSLRKELTDAGFDAGAATIHFHMAERHQKPPSVPTIWRVLRARGFVTLQPQKRPKSSYRRFVADLPNERWQADMTHVELHNGDVYEVLNLIDDHSRVCIASRVMNVVKAHDVIRVLHKSAEIWGYPASLLTDIQADCALGSTVRPAGGGKLRGDRCPLCIAADRSERFATPCLLGVSRAGATPGKERPVRYSVTGPGRIPVGECPARPPRWRHPSVLTRQGGMSATAHTGSRCRLPGRPSGQPG